MKPKIELNEIEQQLNFLNHKKVSKKEKVQYLENMDYCDVENLYYEAAERKHYIEMLDGQFISWHKYPEAKKILLDVMEMKEYNGENQRTLSKAEIQALKVQNERNIQEENFLRQKAAREAEIREEKQKEEKKKQAKLNKEYQQVLDNIQEILDMKGISKLDKIRRVRLEVLR